MKQSGEQMRALITYVIAATGLKPFQVEHTVELLQEGATVPFIARYRKEHTGELDEVQIRAVEEQFAYFSELEERKVTVLKSIEEQGKLTPELRERIEASRQKTEVEDLYLPFKPKRRTKATIARERGLEPLADIIAAQELMCGTPEDAALRFVHPDKEVPDAAAALDGAGHILAERLSDSADARAVVRRLTNEQGVMTARVASDYKEQVTKFEMYYDFQEPLKAIPSHRMLAMRRGEKEEVLYLSISAPVEQILAALKSRLIQRSSIFSPLLERVAEDAYKRLIAPSIEVELRLESKERADEAAIQIFARNLRELLLAPPAGGKRVL
ncbi:MAG: Tex-like N-terminal domain-containing protein, partial [Desulfuromonadaceae bacterium]|nr:Tex-like N-terminal domain-containing protein [Desulfuromonadaceae bacterium]